MLEEIWSLAKARLFVLYKSFCFFEVAKRKQAVFNSEYCGKLRILDDPFHFVFHICHIWCNVGNEICFTLDLIILDLTKAPMYLPLCKHREIYMGAFALLRS